eukprot:TRINITY_DN4101_c0_g1_i4.p1 TRINITY_DN4101_c0_g1~~TRINITY_DN4101_c0_g1_i4.p1  ORF type:complete len:328 (-),score=50.85 TRINITY_DN4101_c0_g1_i4:53-1036(-)
MLMAADFVLKDLNYSIKRKSRSSYTSDEMKEMAESIIQEPSSSIKKYYKKQQISGQGGFGSVFLAKSLKDNRKKNKKTVAIKILPHETSKQTENNLCEIAFLNTLRHPNIVKFYEAFHVDSNIWIVMKFLHGGTLSQAAKSHEMSDVHIAFIAREILQGLNYMHQQNIAHRDIKPSNIMMSIEGEIKLIDFGLCCDFRNGNRTKLCGSPFWIPPEMTKYETYNTKIDVWSFAVCILELFLQDTPYRESSLKAMFLGATIGLSHLIPDRASKEAKKFLKLCFQIDPEQRPTAGELLETNWVTQPDLGKGIEEVLSKIFFAQNLASLGF